MSGEIFNLVSDEKYIFNIIPSKGIFCSSDDGNNWQVSSLNDKDAASLTIIGDKIYAGTFHGGVWVCPISEFTFEK